MCLAIACLSATAANVSDAGIGARVRRAQGVKQAG